MDSREFAKRILDRATENAEKMKKTVLERTPPLSEDEITATFQSHEWREYYLGVFCPAKMIILISPEDLDLKLLLTQQLVEEYHHYQVFAKLVADRGAESDLTRFKAGPAHNGMLEKTLSWEHPVYIAAASNLTGEFILTACMEKLVTLVDKESARVIEEEVMAHEGNHIHIGRLILERYATTPEIQEKVEGLIEDRTDHFIASYSKPYMEFIGPDFNGAP